MFVAFCDHDFGNSTFSCLKDPTAAVRVSHSTLSNGWIPGLVNRRRTLRASPARGSCVSVVCGVVCSIVKSPFRGATPAPAPVGGGAEDVTRPGRNCAERPENCGQKVFLQLGGRSAAEP